MSRRIIINLGLLSLRGGTRKSSFFSATNTRQRLPFSSSPHHFQSQTPAFENPNPSPHHHCPWVGTPSILTSRFLSTTHTTDETDEEIEPIDIWEEEEEAEPQIGDGRDGGGVVLQNCPWGERALSIAQEILLQFDDDMELFSFKTTPRGYIYVRLDKIPNEYGCPGMEELENFSREYKKRLQEVGAEGEIPDDLALEVSSPGAERLLKVPDDLQRFKDMAMRVSYAEDVDARCPEKNGVFYLEAIETESGSCVWRLADVKENRDPSAKGRPMSRKQKDWRLKLPYAMFKKVTLYLDY